MACSGCGIHFNPFTGQFDMGSDCSGDNTAFDASLILTMPAHPSVAVLGWEILFDEFGNVLTKDP